MIGDNTDNLAAFIKVQFKFGCMNVYLILSRKESRHEIGLFNLWSGQFPLFKARGAKKTYIYDYI